MPTTTWARRSGAQLSVSLQTHADIDEMRRDMQAEFRRDVTQDEVVRALMDDSHRLGNIDDMILAAVESFLEAEADGMTSLPIRDVLGFLGELKAEIEEEGEDEPTG
mgnify:CR=1 FL=1